jgi:hypothetical protein
MSRRAAIITQADVARACRAAQQLGPQWFVEVQASNGTIRLMQASPSDRPSPTRDQGEQEPRFARGLDSAP